MRILIFAIPIVFLVTLQLLSAPLGNCGKSPMKPCNLQEGVSAELWLPVAGTDIFIGKFAVTAGEYGEYLEAKGAGAFAVRFVENPAVNVSREDAAAYAEWRSRRDGVQYRLPTAKEWELAAGVMPSEDKPMNCGKGEGIMAAESFPETQGVSGAVGLWGNVWEWTADGGECAMVKGGSWQSTRAEFHTEYRKECRNPEQGYPDVGFRLVRLQ